jgi:AraC-like DNA-binding protein
LRGEVRAQVEQRLSSGNVTIEAIARALHMSGRTLQRRLDDERLSFQDVLDDARRTRATLYLEDPRIGLSEVAFRLGYADVRSFTRAYKRWTGAPPRGKP